MRDNSKTVKIHLNLKKKCLLQDQQQANLDETWYQSSLGKGILKVF
jgi:hypothetical protein